MIPISQRIWTLAKLRLGGALLERAGEPQLLVDVSTIRRQDARTGIQRVVRAMLNEMLVRGVPGYAVRPVFATPEHGYRYCCLGFLDDPHEAAEWRGDMGEPLACGPGDVFFGLDLAAHLLPRHEAQIATMKAKGASIVLLVHDLLPVRRSQWFRRRNVRNFKHWLRLLARQCDMAICVSKATQIDLLDWLSERAPATAGHLRTAVVRLSGDFNGSRGSGRTATFGPVMDRPFHLVVGTIEPRKAHGAVLDAFEQRWAADPEAPGLVVVGRPGWKTDGLQARLRRLERSGPLRWFENADDDVLACLYRSCRGVIVASYAEGFGLPLNEAGRFGKPILARDLPVFQENGRPGGLTLFSEDRQLPQALREWDATLDHRTPEPPQAVRGWDMTHGDLLVALARLEHPARLVMAAA